MRTIHRSSSILKLTPLSAAVALMCVAFTAPHWAHAQATFEEKKEEKDEKKGDKKDEVAKVETIVVTASKRAQSAAEVPYNVSAIDETKLREENITDIKKLIAQDVAINSPGNSARFADSVTVRGLNVSPVNANNLEQFVRTTVAYYLDETPLPNIGYRIKDIARVEKLLGPQGTLYGAGSLGGTIRYITNDPKIGKTEATINNVFYQTRFGGMSRDTDVVVNAPIGASFAIRASIANLDEKGYIDRVSNPPWRTGSFAWTTKPDPQQNVYKDDNFQKVDSGRLSLLFQATKDISLKFAHTEQKQFAQGINAVSLLPLNVANATTPAQLLAAWKDNKAPCTGTACRFTDRLDTPLAIDEQTVISRYPEFADRRFKMDSFDFDWNFSFANLHSSTSTFKDTRRGQADYASQGYVFYYDLGDLGADIASDRSAYITFNNAYKGMSHETRLTSRGNSPLQWIGGFYTTKQDRSLQFTEILPGLDAYNKLNRAAVGGNKDEGYFEDLASKYSERAIFGEVGYKFFDKLLLTVGGRYFSYKDTARAKIIDYAAGFVDSDFTASADGKNKSYFKANVSYQFNKDLLTYATFSQGFRRGGTNGFKDIGTRKVADDMRVYQPDSTDNVEIGVKGFLFNRRAFVQANVFQIDWKNPQTYFSQDVNGFPVNGSANGPDARSKGFEFSSRVQIIDGLQANFSAATVEAKWVDTKTQCLYSNGTSCRTWRSGGLLGGAPKWKYNGGMRYTSYFEDGASLSTYVNSTYTGKVQVDRSDDPNAVAVRQRPAYALFSGGLSYSRDNWDLSFWVQNLADKRAEVSLQEAGIMGQRIIYATPRTYGTNFSYRFR